METVEKSNDVKMSLEIGASAEFSPEIGKIMLALSKAQGMMKPAVKDKDNYYKKKYADLASNWESIRAALSTNELAVVQIVGSKFMEITITTVLGHSSGQYFKSVVVIKTGRPVAERSPPQARATIRWRSCGNTR